jgi:hypothetical protein
MGSIRSARLLGAVALLAVMTVLSTAVAGAGEGGRALADARRATAQFHNLGVAIAAGYGEFRDAQGIACIDNALGGMGIHYVNGTFVGDFVVDPRKPEALVYQPMGNGRLRLVALEYIVFREGWDAAHASRPSLFGQEFEPVLAGNRYGIPAFYELHVWLWKHNPRGMFDDWNPRVSC